FADLRLGDRIAGRRHDDLDDPAARSGRSFGRGGLLRRRGVPFLRLGLGGAVTTALYGRLLRDRSEPSADLDRPAFPGGDLLQGARRRRGHLGGDLVGLQLDNRLVDGDRVALLLEPPADGCLGYGLAECGYADFGGHRLVPWFLVKRSFLRARRQTLSGV